MNQMNVAAMNMGPGGPVGGVPMMNTGSAAQRVDGNMINTNESLLTQLNTCIYDYFLKQGHHEFARALLHNESIKLDVESPTKSSPGHRRDGDVNGVDSDMADTKDGDKLKIPEDFPRPKVPNDSQQSFLFDWFSIFWDIFWAQRKRAYTNEARQYVNQTQHFLRMREQQQNQMLRQTMANTMGPMALRRGNMVPNLQKAAMQNSASLTPQQIAQLQKNQMIHPAMQREHSDMDMNGHRPQSPSSADNAPSPSKRPRLEGGPLNGHPMAPNGRGQAQGMPGQPNPQALMIQNGINPQRMNPAFQAAFQQSGPGAQKNLQVYAQTLALHHTRSALNNQGLPNGLMNTGVMPNQPDLMPPMGDGQGLLPISGDFYSNGQMGQVRTGMQTPGGGQNGNHALQDYQMQLMLLEQQNKRRLMMARQEQDSITRADGQAPIPGQQQLPPGTSPQGSRTGASPNPTEQMKRATPKISQPGLPGSPSAGEAMQGRASPSMNYNGQLPHLANEFLFKQDNMMNNMRPPSSNPGYAGPQMGQQGATGNRMPGGNWAQAQQPGVQPMTTQQSQGGQPQPGGTPQERNAMPPPPALPTGAANKPASPQTGAPPTPQQVNKSVPKGKKDPKDNRKRQPKKTAAAANANTAAAPSSEVEPPPTPTPPTPITPQHANSFNKTGIPATSAGQPQPTSAPAPVVTQQQPDPSQQSYDLQIPDPQFNLDFGTLENPDILENFDFDTFLNTDAETAGFGFDPNIGYPTDSVETGAGEGL